MAGRILQLRWPWALMALLAVGFWASTFVELRTGIAAVDPRPVGGVAEIEALRERDDLNLLFILVDTLRADRLGVLGYPRDTSPRIDRLAQGGVLFEQVLAQSSWTKSSMASLWTGLYPSHTGVTRFDHLVPDEALMPAEILSEAGFRCVGLFRNGWVSAYFGFGQGFEVYEKPLPSRIPNNERSANPTLESGGSDIDVVDTATAFLELRGEERWFLYLHLMDVHEYLYDEETALFGTQNSDIYDNALRREDDVLALLLKRLEEFGEAERTIVVFASDHGEAFGERGWEGHARHVLPESTGVPLIISFPFRLDPGIVVRDRVANVDVWPTVLDLLGLPPLPNVDGRSLLPEILAAAQTGRPESEARNLYAHLDQNWGQPGSKVSPAVSIARGSLRYVRGKNVLGQRIEELFDIASDPYEQINLLSERPEVATELRSEADSYLARSERWEGGAPQVEVDEMQLNQLRALGYSLP